MTVADELAIAKVLARYARALDTLSLDLLDEVFIADARLSMSKGEPMNRETYRAMCASVLPGLDATQHIVSNIMIDVAEAGDTATCRSYYQAQHAKNSCDPPLALMGGWVDDDFVRVGGRWLIAARTWTAVWFDGNAEVLGGGLRQGAQRRR